MKGPKIQNLTHEESDWIAVRAASAVIANGEIHDAELKMLGKHYDLMEVKDSLSARVKEVLMMVKPPQQTALNTSLDKGVRIFRFIMQLLTCDLVMGEQDVAYALQTARLLNLGEQDARGPIKDAVSFLRLEFFFFLKGKLTQEQREWLSSMVVKAIYADGQIGPDERPYLNHLSYLLNNDFVKLKQIREGFAMVAIDSIDLSQYSHGDTLLIYRYLVELALQGHAFEPKAMELVRSIGGKMALSESDMKRVQSNVLALLPLL